MIIKDIKRKAQVLIKNKTQMSRYHLLSFLNKLNDIKRNKSTSAYKSRVRESKQEIA
jgi:hypothetical protein